ncbi:MAG: hypothetical protein QOJ89_3912 [bacterium]|jgi:hypothetical protein
MQLDVRAMRLDAAWREALLEACLLGATALVTFGAVIIAFVVTAVSARSLAASEPVVVGAVSGLILASITLHGLHLSRFVFWYVRMRGRRRRGVAPDLGELGRRVPLLMSTDWDFALALAIVVAKAAGG